MTTRDLNIINDLLTRTNSLPDILHLRAADLGYELTVEDKKLLLDTYEKLDDILKETAAFINVKFPGRQDHIHGWNKIDFDTKIGGFKIVTTDREHVKREWRKGIFDLKGLLKSLKNEVTLMIDEPETRVPDNDQGGKSFNGNIIYNEGSSIGNQSLSDNALASPTIQKHKNPTSTTKAKTSTLEKLAWIAAIVGAIVAIIALMN